MSEQISVLKKCLESGRYVILQLAPSSDGGRALLKRTSGEPIENVDTAWVELRDIEDVAIAWDCFGGGPIA
jgi:hypothetical protein